MTLFNRSRQSQKGVALTIAIMLIVCTAILAGYALQAGWNQQKLSIAGGSKRDKIYWKARAGVMDARWRIRNNVPHPSWGGGNLADPNYDPPAYDLDIDGVAPAVDVTVNIGAVVGGVRNIDSQGKDN